MPETTLTKAQKIVRSFHQVADLAFDNLPEGMAVMQFIYVRDKNNRSVGEPDGETVFESMLKGAHVYDVASIRELVDRRLNGLEEQ